MQCGLCLLNGIACIAWVFFVATIVCDPANDFFWVVTASKGAFSECPIPLRLGEIASRSAPSFMRAILSGGFVKIRAKPEIFKMVCLGGS